MMFRVHNATGYSLKFENLMVQTDGGWPSWKIQMIIITKQDQPLSVHVINSKKQLTLQFYWLVGHVEYEGHWNKSNNKNNRIKSQWQIAFPPPPPAFACSPFLLSIWVKYYLGFTGSFPHTKLSKQNKHYIVTILPVHCTCHAGNNKAINSKSAGSAGGRVSTHEKTLK